MMIAKMRCGIDRYLDIISAVYGYGFYESGEVVPMNIVNDVRRLCQKKEACSFVQDFRHNKEFKGKDNFALIEFQCKKDTETCYSVVCPVHSHCVEGKKGPQCICDPGCVLENGVCVDKTIYLDESFKNLSLEHSTIWIPDQVDEITDNVDKLVDNTGSDADVRGVETDKETGTVVLNTDDSDFTTSFDLIENDEEYLDSENSDANEISNPPSVEELGIHQGIDHREYMEDITDKNNMNNNTNVLDDEMLHNDQHEKENGFIMVDQKDKTEISMGTKLDEDGSGEMNENINHDNRNLHNEVEKRDNDVNDTNDNSRIEHKKIDVKENSQDNQKESSSSNAIVNDNQLNSPTDIDAKIGELVDFNSSIVRGNNVGTEETNATGSMDTIINSRLNTNDESHASYTAVSQGKPTNDTYEDHTSVGTPDNGHSNISDDKKISITVPLVENNCAIEAESPDKNLKANYKPPKLDYRYRDNRPNDHSIISDKIGKIFNENENKKSLFSHVDAMENTIMPNITQNGERLSNVIKLGNKGSNNTEETSSPFKCFIPIGQMSVKEKGQQAYVEFEGRHDKDHGHIYRYRHCTANNE